MDAFDRLTEESTEAEIPYSVDVSLEQARLAVATQGRFTGEPVTEEQVWAEMELTRNRCTPCKRRDV